MTDEMKNEMDFEMIHIEEEGRRAEEISVRGSELRETLGRLAQEGRARRITVRNHTGKTLFEIPLVLGAAGVLILGPWTAALLAAAWLTRASILIEYEDAPVAETHIPAVRQIEARIA